jgi:hypothetical protein
MTTAFVYTRHLKEPPKGPATHTMVVLAANRQRADALVTEEFAGMGEVSDDSAVRSADGWIVEEHETGHGVILNAVNRW